LREVEKCGKFVRGSAYYKNRGLVFGIIAPIYFFMMIPPTGGTGPAFATTHSMLSAREDGSPLSRMLRTVR